MAELGVVTGSSRGIGRAIALALAARGLDLALLSRPSEAQSETVRACRAAGVQVQDVPCDVADPDAIEHAAHAVTGTPQVLVNNAGVLFRGSPLWRRMWRLSRRRWR